MRSLVRTQPGAPTLLVESDFARDSFRPIADIVEWEPIYSFGRRLRRPRMLFATARSTSDLSEPSVPTSWPHSTQLTSASSVFASDNEKRFSPHDWQVSSIFTCGRNAVLRREHIAALSRQRLRVGSGDGHYIHQSAVNHERFQPIASMAG